MESVKTQKRRFPIGNKGVNRKVRNIKKKMKIDTSGTIIHFRICFEFNVKGADEGC